MGMLEDDLDWGLKQQRKEEQKKWAQREEGNWKLGLILQDVEAELRRAQKKFPRPQTGPHEGYAVLLEEVDELWDAIKANDIAHSRVEAVQVAAMAIRYLLEGGSLETTI